MAVKTDTDIWIDEDKKIKKSEKIKEPENWAVFLLNDDYTTMEFVVSILVQIFGKDAVEAESLMLEVHHSGRGLAGVYTQDIARTKVAEVHVIAEAHEFPLRCVMEKV